MARQFNLIPPVCEQAEYHMFQREKVEVQLPELFHKIGVFLLEKSHFNTVAEMVAGSCHSGVCAGVGAMTWSPLACGIISGKYDSGVPSHSRASLKVFLGYELQPLSLS